MMVLSAVAGCTRQAPQASPKAVVSRTSTPPANAKAGDVWVSPRDDAAMVYVPAGEFLMGSPEGEGEEDEHPQRPVYLDAYWIDKTPVTVGEYRRFCQATGRAMSPAPEWGWKEDHPVVNVTWEDAVAYAKWAGERLPMEAEWEKAARGTDGRSYPWGNKWDPGKCANNLAWYSHLSSTEPVGSYPTGASPYGALDMAGNVWNWCADWYDGDYYRSAPTRNPTGPTAGNSRVFRGGSWDTQGAMNFRCAVRNCGYPLDRGNFRGFRCVRGPS
jgi:formylglycine-generating enzyme required for sulfatase activity